MSDRFTISVGPAPSDQPDMLLVLVRDSGKVCSAVLRPREAGDRESREQPSASPPPSEVANEEAQVILKEIRAGLERAGVFVSEEEPTP